MPAIASTKGYRTVYVTQFYASFAAKVEKRNPSVVFTKESMDDAFKHAASKIGSTGPASSPEFARMMQRVSRTFPAHQAVS